MQLGGSGLEEMSTPNGHPPGHYARFIGWRDPPEAVSALIDQTAAY